VEGESWVVAGELEADDALEGGDGGTSTTCVEMELDEVED
jgi:hypothetical protein